MPYFLHSIAEFREIQPKFQSFLLTSGEIIFPQTSEWEVLRFSWNKLHATIWQNAKGRLRFSPQADEALQAYAKEQGND